MIAHERQTQEMSAYERSRASRHFLLILRSWVRAPAGSLGSSPDSSHVWRADLVNVPEPSGSGTSTAAEAPGLS